MTATHGQFNGIRQVAPVCTPPNTCFLGTTIVQIPNGISIGSAFFAQLTAERPYTLHGPPFPSQNCLFPWGIWTPSNMISWAHLSPQPKWDLNWYTAIFAQITSECPIPLKIAHSHGGSGPHPIHGSTRVLNPNSISISSAVFAGLTTVRD